MVIFVVEGYAHRVRRDGILESAKVTAVKGEDEKDTKLVISGDWKVTDHYPMNLTGGDIELIRNELIRFSLMFPDGIQRNSPPPRNPAVMAPPITM